MLIFFELGNTRLKAASLKKGRYDYLGSVSHAEMTSDSLLADLGLQDVDVDAVYVCSVVDSESNAKFNEWIQQAFKLYPTYLATQPTCCGIQCGYDAFETFGVDRWMAIIGACSGQNKPTFIVDAGTAITVDVVIEKEHIGGFIVPGLAIMKQSLLDQTALKPEAIQLKDETMSSGLLATNTAEAVAGGTLYMVAAYLNALLADLEKETGRRFDCVGTGGDFPIIEPLLDKSFDYVEDLTLQGMVEVIESL